MTLRAWLFVGVMMLAGCAGGEAPVTTPASETKLDAGRGEPAQKADAGPEDVAQQADAPQDGAAPQAIAPRLEGTPQSQADDAGSTAPAAKVEARPAKAKRVKQFVDGRCEPMPKAGEPCREGDGYCVLSWGEPGGHSEALWCRGGKWELEQERNLPE